MQLNPFTRGTFQAGVFSAAPQHAVTTSPPTPSHPFLPAAFCFSSPLVAKTTGFIRNSCVHDNPTSLRVAVRLEQQLFVCERAVGFPLVHQQVMLASSCPGQLSQIFQDIVRIPLKKKEKKKWVTRANCVHAPSNPNQVLMLFAAFPAALNLNEPPQGCRRPCCL